MEKSQQILSDITAYMKYARYLPEQQRRETWEETVTRNKEMHLRKFPDLADEIEQAYSFVYDKKILPSMRALQFGGLPIELNNIRQYNCSFVALDSPEVFHEAMFMLLSGTGVGYSVQKHHVRKLPPLLGVQKPQGRQRKKRYLVGDSIIGWADAIKVLVESYFYGKREVDFDYRDIRPKGSQLITSGGKAPGHAPLQRCITNISTVFEDVIETRGRGAKLKPIECHDIMCYIADAVLAGGIRRAAMISLFSLDDYEMLECKFGNWWEINPQRGRANNSAVILRSQITEDVFKKIWSKVEASGSGEPGIFMSDSEEWGANPCCFTGDMRLLTADGYVRFDELDKEIGFALDTMAGRSEGCCVWKVGEKETVKVTYRDGTEITCTPDHKFLRDEGWIEAQNLAVYDDVESVVDNGIKTVYDFNEPMTHMGIVEGKIVHNCEISLRSAGLCNLVEINFSNIESQEDLNERARAASFIATLQASYTDFHYLREVWSETTEKEALIGVSLTGVASSHLYDYDLSEPAQLVVDENRRVADMIGINPSARCTTLKPSGTSSIILGTSSGVHAWYDEYYWRRVRVGKNEPIYTYLSIMHPNLLEDDEMQPGTTAIIKVPQKAPEGAVLRTETALETLERVKYMHEHWVAPGHVKGINKNNVSVTVNVRDGEWEQVGQWMWDNRGSYTGISVLPYDNGSYRQAPFETCTKEEYEEAIKHLEAVDLSMIIEENDNTKLQATVACSGGACEIKSV